MSAVGCLYFNSNLTIEKPFQRFLTLISTGEVNTYLASKGGLARLGVAHDAQSEHSFPLFERHHFAGLGLLDVLFTSRQ
jgi:hypothetical protein